MFVIYNKRCKPFEYHMIKTTDSIMALVKIIKIETHLYAKYKKIRFKY